MKSEKEIREDSESYVKTFFILMGMLAGVTTIKVCIYLYTGLVG